MSKYAITAGVQDSPVKTVLYGPEGIGKSTFASHFPDPVFIDTEGGTKRLNIKRLPQPTSWAMLLDEVAEVRRGNIPCGTLVIDTADWAERLAIDAVCAKAKVDGLEGFGYGKGYIYLKEEFGKLLDALEEILNPRVVTYTGKLYKAWQLLGSIGQEKSPYENVLREVAADLETLNKSLRALNASIGHYIDRLTHNRTPQEVLELFDQYEEKVVAAAYHRFKTSDNLFNYRAYLEEELDDCEQNQLPRLALDYARVERCAPGEAAPRVRALIQQQRDALEEMSTLMKEIDASHIRYRKRAVQRAQFLLLSDRSAQGSVTALLRRYAEEIRSPEQLFEPDDGPVAARLHLYPAAVFGAKPLYPPAAPRTEAPLAPVRTEPLDPDRLRQEQQLLLDYARLAVTEENVALLAQQALAARGQVNASTLVEEYPNDFTGIIGLHTYSQSPHREYDITMTGNWVERGGFRFQDFVLTRRKEVNTDGNH